jgi:hypothetical protein
MATFDVLGAKKAGYSDAEIVEYLAGQKHFDFVSAKEAGYSDKELINYLNKTDATPWETFKTSAAQEVGSEIKGAAQILGNEPTDTAAESLRRQMESENPVAGVLGSIAGGLVNPSTLLPGSMLFKGAKGLIAGGAAAGAIGGALQPRYEEEDMSRLGATALGATAGAGLVGALVGGQKAIAKVFNKLTKSVEEIPVDKIVPNIHEPIPNEQGVVDNMPSGITNLTEQSKQLQDNITPFVQGIEDAEKRTQVALDIDKGDYRSFFTDSPLRLTETPDFRIMNAFSPENPFREQNFEAYLKAGYKAESPEKLLERIVQANKTGVMGELDTTPIDIPADSAVNFLLNRKVQEIGGRDIQAAYLPALQRGVDLVQSIDELFMNGRAAGMSDLEIAAIFKKDFDEVKPLLFSAIGNVSNIGRALQAAKAQKRVLGSVTDILKGLEKNGGQELNDIFALRDAVSTIKSSTDTAFNKAKGIADLTQAAVKQPNWKDKFGEFVVNSYISGLATTAVNAASGIAKIGLLGAERVLQTLNPFSKAKFGELVPAFRGMMDGMLEGAYFAKEGFLRGHPLDAALPELRGAIGMQEGATKAEQIAGQIIRTPGRLSVGVDEYFKSVFRKMEFNAQAYRVANSGKYGDPAAVYDALRSINTMDKNWKDNVLKAPGLSSLTDTARKQLITDVTNYAKQATFQADLGKLGNSMLRFRANHPELSWVIPFVKTPINIMKDALSYTPLGVFSKNMPADVKIARTAIGVGITMGLGQAIASGNVTGAYPRDAGQRNALIAAGIPEYSLKIGDTWYSYARVEPLATIMGATVDGIKAVVDYAKKPSYDTKKEKDLVIDVVGGITKNIASKTFLEGISSVMQVLHDPERYGGSFLNSFAGLVVPSFVAAPARALDPNQRIVTNFAEAVQNRLPSMGQEFARENLPAQSMLFGGTRPNPSFGATAFTGLQTAPAAQTALQQEVSRIKFDYELPSKSLKGVELNGADQAKYQALSGQYADLILNKVIESPSYQNAADPLKKVILEKGMRRARTAATKVLFGEKMQDPEFRVQFIRAKLAKKGIEEE